MSTCFVSAKNKNSISGPVFLLSLFFSSKTDEQDNIFPHRSSIYASHKREMIKNMNIISPLFNCTKLQAFFVHPFLVHSTSNQLPNLYAQGVEVM